MLVTPYSNVSAGKKEQVEEMFNAIAFRYDLLNQLLSFGIHKRWRRKAIRLLDSFVIRSAYPPCELDGIRLSADHSSFVILDVATGTGDFAIEAVKLNPQKITGIDISEDMLERGRKKVENRNLSSVIELLRGDAENLSFPDNCFDAATVGFGVRNFENLEKGLSEICRALKKGGTLAVLEFSIPEKFPIRQLYHFYLKYFCPFLGKLLSKNPIAYTYLFQSISSFPCGKKFGNVLLDCGFSSVKYFPQTFGITTIYLAQK